MVYMKINVFIQRIGSDMGRKVTVTWSIPVQTKLKKYMFYN